MKILILDDHPLIRKGLLTILSAEPDIEVVGEASNIGEAVSLIIEKEPDQVVLDLKLKNEYGLNLLDKVDREKTNCKFILFSSSINEIDFRKAEKVGVSGLILKEALPEEIIYAIRLIHKGRKYYDPEILETMIDKPRDISIENLTAREKDILIELSRGLSNKEIARNLYITEYTVKKYVSQLLTKLKVSDRTQAALYAINRRMTNIM